MYLRYFWLRRKQLFKCLKDPTPFGSQHVSGLKILLKPARKESPFIFLFHLPEMNWVRKCFIQSDLKSQDCLVTYWLPMAIILLIIERILCNQFKCNYLKIKIFFLSLLLCFWHLHKILNIKKKRLES